MLLRSIEAPTLGCRGEGFGVYESSSKDSGEDAAGLNSERLLMRLSIALCRFL